MKFRKAHELKWFKTGKSAKELSVNDVWYMWKLLRTRYRVIEYTQFYLNFAHDTDLRLFWCWFGWIVRTGKNWKICISMALPCPPRRRNGQYHRQIRWCGRPADLSKPFLRHPVISGLMEVFRSCANAKSGRNLKNSYWRKLSFWQALEYGVKGWLQSRLFRVD